MFFFAYNNDNKHLVKTNTHHIKALLPINEAYYKDLNIKCYQGGYCHRNVKEINNKKRLIILKVNKKNGKNGVDCLKPVN